jgi:hypothetical protein
MATIPYVLNGLGVVLGLTAWAVNRRREVHEEEEGGRP